MSIFECLVYEQGNDRDYLAAIESALDGADLDPSERVALEREADQVSDRIVRSRKGA